jgi:TPP-dependent pyruvate/acetoin dehydrogenase alpha subunit
MDPIQTIISQTNYTEEEAMEKLKEHGDPIRVIKEYLGIDLNPKPREIKSINQEIYKCLRKQIDVSKNLPA